MGGPNTHDGSRGRVFVAFVATVMLMFGSAAAGAAVGAGAGAAVGAGVGAGGARGQHCWQHLFSVPHTWKTSLLQSLLQPENMLL